MTFASEVRFTGQSVRDAELAYTPEGKPVSLVDMAVHEGEQTVYVPVMLKGPAALDICKQRTMGERFMVVGHLWRPRRSISVPYPPLTVVAYVFNKIAKVETPCLFAEAAT